MNPSREKIWEMFDTISPTYDRTNRIMTAGLDQLWRKKLGKFLPQGSDLEILDCATGTGDQIIALMQHSKCIRSIVGVDLSEEMLNLAKAKVARKPYAKQVTIRTASALDLPFSDKSFDCVTVSFGVRNFTDVMKGLKEFHRVLKPGGRLLILEGTVPTNPWLRYCHNLYLNYCLPLIGGMLSKQTSAYRYLNDTIRSFPQGEKFCSKMRACGFLHVRQHLLLKGVATIYQGDTDGMLHY